MPPTHLTPGWPAAGAPLDQVGTRAPGPAARERWRRAFRRGRGLAGPGNARAGAHRAAAHAPTPPRPRGRRAAVTRRYPQGSVRGTELSPDEKDQSASSGGSRRHPARRLVVAGPPGYSGPLAHQYRPGSCAPGRQWSRTLRVTSAPPSRSTPLLFSGSSHHHSWRCAARRAAPRVSADSLRKPSSPLGGGMIPAVPAHPAHHSSGPTDH